MGTQVQFSEKLKLCLFPDFAVVLFNKENWNLIRASLSVSSRSVKKCDEFLLFSKKCIFIHQYLYCPLPSNPLRYNTPVPALFPILEALFGVVLRSSSNAVLSPQSCQISVLSWVPSVLETEKSRSMITVLFLAKKYEQAMACDLAL